MRTSLATLHVLAKLLLITLPASAFAQIYVCKDENGHTITADHPIPECAKQKMRELDRNGVTRREIPAPLTAHQKREREALEEKQRVDAAVLEEQRLYDRALTTRYRSESEIGESRQKSVELLNEQMRIDTNALALEMKEMHAAEAALMTPAAAKPSTGAPAPKATGQVGTLATRKRLEDASRAVERRLSSIEQRTAEIARTDRKYDLALKRFREIQAALDNSAAKASGQ